MQNLFNIFETLHITIPLDWFRASLVKGPLFEASRIDSRINNWCSQRYLMKNFLEMQGEVEVVFKRQ
jgi:hypothetical protein